MTNDEYAKWLAELKVGDKVSIVSGYPWRSVDEATFVQLGTVIRFTKTQVVTSRSRFMRKSGVEQGKRIDRQRQIVPVTQEHMDREERYNLVIKLCRLDWSDLSLETLRQVAAVIEEGRM